MHWSVIVPTSILSISVVANHTPTSPSVCMLSLDVAISMIHEFVQTCSTIIDDEMDRQRHGYAKYRVFASRFKYYSQKTLFLSVCLSGSR